MAIEEKNLKSEYSDVVVTTTEKISVKHKEKSLDDTSDEESTNEKDSDEGFTWTEEEEATVRRKIDLKLMTLLMAMTFVLNMDRTNISNAVSDNLAKDLGFNNDGVNTSILIYAIIFTLVAFPSNIAVKYVGAHIWLPFLMNSWGIVTWCHAFINNYTGFIWIRVFIAVTEAGFIPACLMFLGSWYKTREMSSRLAWFWGIQSFASAFSGLISAGIFKMRGINGLYGWKWLFIIDGIFTHVVGIIAMFYIPASPLRTRGGFRGKNGWFTEREERIAHLRIIRDDSSKMDDKKKVTWTDAKLALLDTKLWTHLIITFVGLITITPIGTYLPSLLVSSGFSLTDANLLTAPGFILGLTVSIIVAHSSEKRGYVALHALFGCLWSMTGFLALLLLPDNANRWSRYAAALIAKGTPSWHGMQIAWMSSNVAPVGKRALALGAVIGAANICGVPGSQIYRTDDAPYYRRGNAINVAIQATTFLLFLGLHIRYVLTNRYREKKWNSMTEEEKNYYNEHTKDVGSNRLDFRFKY